MLRNEEFQGGTGKFYTAIKGLGRQVHIHTESDPLTAHATTGVNSLCGKKLDVDLADANGRPNHAYLDYDERPSYRDPVWEHTNFEEATCTTCVNKARKLRGH